MPGERMRAAREAAGLSLAAMAARANISKPHLGMLETGRRRVRPEHIAAYEAVLGRPLDSARQPGPWDAGMILDRVAATVNNELMPPDRRTMLIATAALTGAALSVELEPLLWPVAYTASGRGDGFAADEVEAAEHFVEQARSWQWQGSALARRTVATQLKTLTRHLRGAPQGAATTTRAFRVAAELADIAASMAWDAADHIAAQQYATLSAQLAHAAGDDALAAGVLLSLARQCFYLGRPDDGLEVVQLAQYATRRMATPRLRSALATREAWAYALRADASAFRRAVTLAEDYHAEGPRDPDLRTPCARSLDTAELAGVIGGRYGELARAEPQFAREAQRRIEHALQIRKPTQTRDRAFDMVELARTHLITQEPERSAELIAQVLPLAEPWSSGRVGALLNDYWQESTPFAEVPAVREIRHAINDLIPA